MHPTHSVVIFCNDVCDQCTVVGMRNCKMPKSIPCFIYTRQFKQFNEQAFLHDVYNSDLHIVSQIADVDLAWDYFKSLLFFLLYVINMHLLEDLE